MGAFEILPTEGVGQVRFGQKPGEVQAIMSEPQVYENWMGGDLNDSLLYQGLILGFDRCDSRGPLRDSRFVEARMTARVGASLFGKQVVEWTRDELVALLRSRGHALSEVKNEVSVEAVGLSVSFDEAGRVDYIELWEPTLSQRSSV